jgi:hypothetical protein
MDVEQLRSRVRLLEDERAILGTLHAYGHAIDYGDEERYLDLWTDDAAFDARGRAPGDVTRPSPTSRQVSLDRLRAGTSIS